MKCKKILSLALVLAMVVQLFAGLGNVAEASSATEVTITGLGGYSASYTDSIPEQIGFTIDGKISDGGWYNATITSGKVKLNGAEKASFRIQLTGQSSFVLVRNGYQPASNDIITIPAGTQFTINDTTAVYEITNEYSIQYDGAVWNEYVEPAGVTPITINGRFKQFDASAAGNTPEQIGFTIEGTIAGAGNWPNGSITQGNILLNDAGQSEWKVQATGTSTFNLVCWNYTPVAGDIITIPAGTQLTIANTIDNTDDVYNITNEYVIKYDGTTWNGVVTADVSFKITRRHKQFDATDPVQIGFAIDGTIEGAENWPNGFVIQESILLNNVAQSNWTLQATGTSMFNLVCWNYTPTEKDVITIPAGLQFTCNGKVYEITETFTVYYYDNGYHAEPQHTLMLEGFEDFTNFDLMNPLQTGYAQPTFQITRTGVDEGEALQINWASTDTLKSYQHQLLPNDVWAHQTFAENANDYAYFRLWINNPTFIPIELTVKLYNNSTKVYMNADSALLTRKDGTVMSNVTGNASGAGENSSIQIPSGFSGWVAYPIRLDALTGAGGGNNITSFSEVNSIEIDVRRPETFDKDSYYVLDNICISNNSVGKLQNSVHGDYGSAEGTPFETELKNVIVLVGDGMGQTILQATRDYKGEALYMDGMEYKSTTISSNNFYDELTDSSAGGTALSCGERTVNGHVALDSDGESIENMVEFFTRAGKKSGLVTTSYLLDATPTTYGSRGLRGDYSVLGKGLFENNISVLLGGGTDYFNSPITHEGQEYTLLDYAQAVYGYTYVNHASELRNFDGDKLLGLFGTGYMDYEIDRNDSQPTLAEMTGKAISLLEDEEGFFLMVEGGNIDHAAHANDLNRTITDTIAFDDAVKVALDYMKEHPDTLVVVCADHSTGGLTETSGSYIFTTNNHDMSLTACFASGFGSEHFEGLSENADIALAVRKAAWEAQKESENDETPGSDTSGSGTSGSDTSGSDISGSHAPENNAPETETMGNQSSKTESPSTGDTTNPGMPILFALVSVVGIYVVVKDKRKKSLNL